MIFLCGIPSEPSLGLVLEQLREMGAPHVVFHQRRFATTTLDFEISDGRIHGHMTLDGQSYPIEDFHAVYTRLMDYRFLPEVEKEPQESPLWQYCQSLHNNIVQWYEITPGRVMNRTQEIGISYSKPLQSQLIRRLGFGVPETLVTNDPELVRDFVDRHGRVIYKSISYIRSIVKMVEKDEIDRLEDVRTCPVQFQEYIEGDNVRVHTVGDKVFPTRIKAESVDYRYAYQEGQQEKLEPTTIPEELEHRCVALSKAFGLEFGGIDLMMTAKGEVYCLEVNPSPAFSYYQLHTGQPIATAVAEFLAAADRAGGTQEVMAPRR